MGLEDFDKKSLPQQGDAGFATDEMISGLYEGAEPSAEQSSIAAPEVAEPAVDTQSADLDAESAPIAPLTPERHAEILEAIGEEETRLEENLATNREVISAAETRLDAPASEENRLKPLLSRAQIGELYKKTAQKLELVALLGLIGTGASFLTGQITAGGGPMVGMDTDALEKAQHFVEKGQHIAENGLAAGIGVIAIVAIAQSMNWLRRRSQEKARYAAA
ncbi:MAG: hypothetical protein JWN49_577 [Parcubacteria group bacterium]|nr:hypothetical protein [Parcubacteria group bacterium]